MRLLLMALLGGVNFSPGDPSNGDRRHREASAPVRALAPAPGNSSPESALSVALLAACFVLTSLCVLGGSKAGRQATQAARQKQLRTVGHALHAPEGEQASKRGTRTLWRQQP
jgi:hypothetical protein